MSLKKFILVILLPVHTLFSLSDKTSTLIMHGIGACFIGNYFYKSLPEFFKNDEHKKPTQKSILMVGKVGATIWYAHKLINYSKRFFDDNYVIGSLKDDGFSKPILEMLNQLDYGFKKITE